MAVYFLFVEVLNCQFALIFNFYVCKCSQIFHSPLQLQVKTLIPLKYLMSKGERWGNIFSFSLGRQLYTFMALALDFSTVTKQCNALEHVNIETEPMFTTL